MPLKMRQRDWMTERDAVPRQGMWELAVCSRFPVRERVELPIGHVQGDPPGPRHALALTLDVHGSKVEFIGLHTSSKVWKLAPVKHLMGLRRHLAATAQQPQIIAGDFNFWGPPVGALFRGWHRPVRGRSYPAHQPHSQIDHILFRGGLHVIDAGVLTETPSDHRPVRARLQILPP
jgi:endonuclease/exonuclease/phosphatase (EEP) superfamily protein YafD